MNKIDIFSKVKEYIKRHNTSYELDINYNYIRVGYWERADNKLEDFLYSLGFKLDVFLDEDKGSLISYRLDTTKELYNVTNSVGDNIIVEYYGIAYGDEHKAGELIFLAPNNKKYYQSELIIHGRVN